MFCLVGRQDCAQLDFQRPELRSSTVLPDNSLVLCRSPGCCALWTSRLAWSTCTPWASCT